MTAIIQRCLDCDTRLFPPRLLCPSCGGNQLGPSTVDSGTVEQSTTLADGTIVATVRPDGGPILIARLIGSTDVGTHVALTNESDTGSGHAYVPNPVTTHKTSREDS